MCRNIIPYHSHLSTVSIPYSYRYGFCAKQGEERAVSFAIPRYSGKRQEREQQLNQSVTSAEYWFYDGRLGRRWNVEPLIKKYPYLSSYACFNNNPIIFIDIKGDRPQTWLLKALYEIWFDAEALRFSDKFYQDMDALTKNSYDSKGNSLENGATIVLNLGTKEFELINKGGEIREAHHFTPKMLTEEQQKKYVYIGVFHTHPRGKEKESVDFQKLSTPPSGDDIGHTLDGQNAALTIVQSYNDIYVLVATPFTPESYVPYVAAEYNELLEAKYQSLKEGGLNTRNAFKQATEYTTKELAKRYNLLYFKGNKNSKKLNKQDVKS